MSKKGIIAGVVIIIILIIIGNAIDRGEVKEYEKEIIASIEAGDYYDAVRTYESYSGETVNGYSKNTDKLVNDALAYLLIKEELQASNPDFEYIEVVFDEMTGRYKKYKTFKKDVKDLKKEVKERKKELD